MELLKDKLVKAALKKILGSAVTGGFKAFVIKFIAVELFDEVALPFFKFLRRNGFLQIDKTTGKVTMKKVERAKVEHNEAAYLNNISNV